VSTTLSDIARATQTSVSTVSRALSGSVAANRLNLDTRQRIQAAA
jgi:DNA-binding LacI/PurR family transcriptional regulator